MLSDRFVVFDVETPNYQNNRMSAIGIAVVENGVIVDSFSSLINPEVRFDSFNIQLTGISPDMVADKPTFGQLWDEMEPIMSSGILVAHNAAFDMSVLSKCLHAYGISWRKQTDYACTCIMGRKCYPQFVNHKLNTMCENLSIELKHHDAGSDALACAGLLVDYLQQGFPVDKYIRCYCFQKY